MAKKVRAAAAEVQQVGQKLFGAKSPPYRSGRNLYDWIFQFRDYGIGKRFTRKIWQYPEPCYWTITKAVPTDNDPVCYTACYLFA